MYNTDIYHQLGEAVNRTRFFTVTNIELTLLSILPALAFSLDMFVKTDMSFGVNEVLLASVLGSVVFSLAAAQPLVIVGVTGMDVYRLLMHYTDIHAGPITGEHRSTPVEGEC